MQESVEKKFQHYSLTSQTKVYTEFQSVLLRNRLKLWKRALKPILKEIKAAKNICDYGCGPGDFLLFLKTITDARLLGYDPSESQVKRAGESLNGVPNVTISQVEPIKSGEFDLVFCNHVIEHVPDAELVSFVGKLTKILTPEGKVIIATPNGLNPFAYTYFMASDFSHVRMHSAFTLAEILELNGFQIQSVHRELPQVYDIQTFAKFCVWAVYSTFAKLAILSHAGGVRGLAYPLTMASTFYVVATRKRPSIDSKL